jgi:hypothetical protein
MTFISSVYYISLLVGCQEYNIEGGAPNYGDVNPPDVENPTQEDRIVQVTTPDVDILWVVDNSSSMGPYQAALAENFPVFMDFFLNSGLNYHIGVVSTDMDRPNQSGKLVEASTGERYITLETEDPMSVFAEMAQLGEIVGSVEKGRSAAYEALEILKDDYNEGFLRDGRDAGVHVIIISDEPDYTRENEISKDEFVEYMNNLRSDDENVSFNSICTPPNVPIQGGDDYVYVTERVGGVLHDIRENSWVKVLEDLGFQAAGLKREYFLSKLPVVNTIEVQVHDPEGNVIPFDDDEYTYSGSRNSITFNTFVPEPLSEVYIQYTILSAVTNQEE